jgi:hypothetical protein
MEGGPSCNNQVREREWAQGHSDRKRKREEEKGEREGGRWTGEGGGEEVGERILRIGGGGGENPGPRERCDFTAHARQL